MRLNLMLEPQEGRTYPQLAAVAARVEAAGLDGLYRSDHYSSVAGREDLGSTDAWATLAGLARETSTIRLGTLVTPVTFRTAGNLAKVGYSLMTGALVGRTEGEVRDRARRLQAQAGNDGPLDQRLDERRPAWVVGTLAQAGARLEQLAQAGVRRVMLQHQLIDDPEAIDVVGELTIAAPLTG